MPASTASATYYDILALPTPLRTSFIPPKTLKTAYRHALLQNHPDKSSPASSCTSERPIVYSIDEITRAYQVLGHTKKRAEYDLVLLKITQSGGEKGIAEREGKTGLETVDLDDLEFEGEGKEAGTWSKQCRCGDENGFVVTEEDLEGNVSEGEIVVGCRGCSLSLKVLFGVLDG
ncbi:CSL zinc finger-domain-containing protein [Bisporella sp. PMI_857]|nr:CSL zinc finger-domain-containing protein [Bisporella sp. PMI_857]